MFHILISSLGSLYELAQSLKRTHPRLALPLMHRYNIKTTIDEI
jgi:hypothetical protein